MRLLALLAAGLLLAGVAAACGDTPGNTTAVIPAPTPPSPRPTAPLPSAPLKGLSDNPAFQWWRWPGGAQPDSWWGEGQNAESLRAQTDLMRELGVRMFRVELVWAFVEPQRPGTATYDSELARDSNWIGYHWARWDMIVDAATAAGLELVPQVYYTPQWAGGVPFSLNGGPNQPPTSQQYYGDFLYAAASRYKERIHFWELWNEPDYGPRAWNGTLNQYVGLILKPGYEGVKAADPSAKVLLGGLAGDTHLKSMYDAGAGPYFDIVSFHAYYAAAAGDSTALDHIRAAMRANNDAAKPVWLTEFGMETRLADTAAAPSHESPAAEAAQARLIHDVYAGLKADAIFLYELHDTAVYGPAGPIKYVYWGLVSRDWSRSKPGLDAFRDAAVVISDR
jgi:hypothetical protein